MYREARNTKNTNDTGFFAASVFLTLCPLR
jgi:hypothetical protein